MTDSVKSAADCFPGVKRVAGGGYEISSDEILFADDTQSNTTTAAPADVSPLREINTEDDVAGAEGEAIENIEVQPGLASDAPGYGGADEDDSPSRGGVDAAGLEEHSSDSSNEEPAAEHHVNYNDTRRWLDLGNYSAGRPRGDAAAGALSAGAIKLESTGRPPDDAAADTLSAGANEPESKRGRLGHAAADKLPTGRPRGGEDAGALSTGAIKIESTGHPPDNAAAGALSAGAIKLESKCGLLGHAAADALSTGRLPGNAAAGALG